MKIGPKKAAKRLKKGVRFAKTGEDGPKTPKNSAKAAQHDPKTAPRRPQDGPEREKCKNLRFFKVFWHPKRRKKSSGVVQGECEVSNGLAPGPPESI